MTEPTYEYYKGKGWVPCSAEVFFARLGPYAVTAIKRFPEDGENFLVLQRDENPQHVLDDMTSDNWFAERANLATDMAIMGKDYRKIYSKPDYAKRVVTLKIDRVE